MAKIFSDPVHPNAGVTAAYRRKLEKLVADMDRSLTFWLKANYRREAPRIAQDAALAARYGVPVEALDVRHFGQDENGGFYVLPLRELLAPRIAQDASAASELRRVMRRLTRRWLRNFDKAAPELAEWFATAAGERTDSALAASLRKAGFTVKFKPTRAQNEVFQATVGENVALIKSIAQQHLAGVEGALMRSVAAGRDLGGFAKTLETTYGVTARRAAFIARDQNNKATATMTRVRQNELGIKQAKWLHSAGGKEPRPSHVANSGKLYDVAKGWYDPDAKQWIRPGELPNCRCVSVSVVPGFDD